MGRGLHTSRWNNYYCSEITRAETNVLSLLRLLISIFVFCFVGVLVESSLMCTFRSVLEATGLKVKVADMEVSPTVDMDHEDNSNPHRGMLSYLTVYPIQGRPSFLSRLVLSELARIVVFI